MDLKKSVLKNSIQITSGFEGSGYAELCGNFDGQYMSMGFLQWNLGMGTLQPLLKKFLKSYPALAKTIFPDNSLETALNKGTEKDWALRNQVKNNFVSPWKEGLTRLCKTSEFQEIQDSAARYYIDTAINLCDSFKLYTDRAYCLLFDIAVQNGSVPVFALPAGSEIDKLRAIAEKAASRANAKWQNDVRSRKMCIVSGAGVVHGEKFTPNFNDSSAFYDNDMRKSVDYLVKVGIISSPDYWMENADGQIKCDGKYVYFLITKATNTQSLEEGIKVLIENKVLSSPDYWLENAKDGKTCRGDYLKSLIGKLAKFKGA